MSAATGQILEQLSGLEFPARQMRQEAITSEMDEIAAEAMAAEG